LKESKFWQRKVNKKAFTVYQGNGKKKGAKENLLHLYILDNLFYQCIAREKFISILTWIA